MGVNRVALAWGFAEATLFFIAPDVWLTLVARERLRTGLIASLYSLAGALAGGALIYWLGATHQQTLIGMMEALPAIGPAMLERVQATLLDQGASATLLGPLSGTPYKLYAAQAAHSGIGLIPFLLISIPARMIRFLLLTLASNYGLKVLSNGWPGVNRLLVLSVCWVLFYGWYFSVMPG